MTKYMDLRDRTKNVTQGTHCTVGALRTLAARSPKRNVLSVSGALKELGEQFTINVV
jgi:hypothetical protein